MLSVCLRGERPSLAGFSVVCITRRAVESIQKYFIFISRVGKIN
jgi:hypothetical protein